METLESLKRHLDSTEDLRSVVKTMKAIAAVNIRQYEQAADALSEYNNAVSMGFQILLKKEPYVPEILTTQRGEGTGAIIYGSEMGMVGRFNEEIVTHAAEKLGSPGEGNDNIFIMTSGYKAISLIGSAGYSADKVIKQPGSVEGIGPAVEEILLEYLPWRRKFPESELYLFYNARTGGASYKPRTQKLLPLDPLWLNSLKEKEWPSRALPRFPLKWDKYFSLLFKQYLYVSIYRAFAESLASENASRLASMQAAEKNIDEQMQELRSRFNQRRQSSVTAELLDIASGFEALETEGNGKPEGS
jgi:F-type H+-transporting ATPase subunit gamma